MTEKGTGKSRGFGYVTFFDQQDAEEAIKAIDGLVRCNRFNTIFLNDYLIDNGRHRERAEL